MNNDPLQSPPVPQKPQNCHIETAVEEFVRIYRGDQVDHPVIEIGGCFVIPDDNRNIYATLTSLRKTIGKKIQAELDYASSLVD